MFSADRSGAETKYLAALQRCKLDTPLLAAGSLVGNNLVKRLYNDVEDVTVIGIDNMNDYYDVRLKEARLEELSAHPSFVFIKGSIADKAIITDIFEKYKPQVVVNLVAQSALERDFGFKPGTSLRDGLRKFAEWYKGFYMYHK